MSEIDDLRAENARLRAQCDELQKMVGLTIKHNREVIASLDLIIAKNNEVLRS